MYVTVNAEFRWMYVDTGNFVHLLKWPEKFQITLNLLEGMIIHFYHYVSTYYMRC
jgi:hypothetical protein